MDIEKVLFSTESWSSASRTSGNGFVADGFDAAANAIKFLVSEREKSNTIMGEMAAEIERLLVYIESSNYAWMKASDKSVSYKHGESDNNPNSGDVFLASPIPAQQSNATALDIATAFCHGLDAAQQSPAVAVQYQSAVSGMWYSNPNAAGEISRVKVNGELFVVDSGSQSPRITEQDDNLAALVVQELYSNGGAHESQIEKARRIIGFISSRLPDRVTEQELREIALAFVEHWIGDKEEGRLESFENFMLSDGRALLAKLNKPESVGG